MNKDYLAGKVVPNNHVRDENHTLVIPNCSSLHEFLQRGLPLPQPVQGIENGEHKEGDVLVIRGFDNLLHYLDWLDAQAWEMSANNRRESEN